MDKQEVAADLLKWLRSTGRKVWVDAKYGGLEFDDEYGVSSDMAERLLAAHDDIVLLLQGEQVVNRIRDDSKGQA